MYSFLCVQTCEIFIVTRVGFRWQYVGVVLPKLLLYLVRIAKHVQFKTNDYGIGGAEVVQKKRPGKQGIYCEKRHASMITRFSN